VKRLRRVLAGQWIAFGLVLMVACAGMTLLLLFLLEDRFIDDRLRAVGADIVALDAAPLPERFELHARAAAPAFLQAPMAGRGPGRIREFRLPGGRYVHVLAGRTPAGEEFLLVHDVSHQLHVNEALARAWPWLLAMAALLSLLAWALARLFVGRVTRQAHALVAQIGGSDDPDNLQALAARQDIEEFAELARLAATAWRSRLQVLARERETLAFLGHELRTPLQSARTSLALLDADRGNEVAWGRLRRAQDRLARASHSVLWLAGDAAPPDDARCEVAPLLRALADEFSPLAAARGQRLDLDVTPGLAWPLPPEVAEAVLANGLLNAIQHGGAGDIHVHADATGLALDNPQASDSTAGGFGLGLSLAGRLLARFGGALSLQAEAGRVRLCLRLRAGC